MEKSYSPSRGILLMCWCFVVLIPAIVPIVTWLDMKDGVSFFEMDIFDQYLILYFSGFASVMLLYNSYYPVILPDRIQIRNAMLNSLAAEYDYSDIRGIKVSTTTRNGNQMVIALKGKSGLKMYPMAGIKPETIEEINNELSSKLPPVSNASMMELIKTVFRMPQFKALFVYLLVGFILSFIF